MLEVAVLTHCTKLHLLIRRPHSHVSKLEFQFKFLYEEKKSDSSE